MAARDRTASAGNGSPNEWLTVNEFCTEFKISRRSFDRWRRLGKAPHVERLAGNGPIRIKRSWVTEWLESGAA